LNGLVNRLGQLEARFERLILQFQALWSQVQALATKIAGLQQQAGSGQGGGGGVCFSMAGVVIAAATGSFPTLTPGSVTGQTVYSLIGGTPTAVSTNATVYNQMQAATVVTKTIMLGMNPDGTYSAIAQSC